MTVLAFCLHQCLGTSSSLLIGKVLEFVSVLTPAEVHLCSIHICVTVYYVVRIVDADITWSSHTSVVIGSRVAFDIRSVMTM